MVICSGMCALQYISRGNGNEYTHTHTHTHKHTHARALVVMNTDRRYRPHLNTHTSTALT